MDKSYSLWNYVFAVGELFLLVFAFCFGVAVIQKLRKKSQKLSYSCLKAQHVIRKFDKQPPDLERLNQAIHLFAEAKKVSLQTELQTRRSEHWSEDYLTVCRDRGHYVERYEITITENGYFSRHPAGPELFEETFSGMEKLIHKITGYY